MTPERIAKLDKLGFAWDCRSVPKDKSDNNNNNNTNSPEVTSNKPAAEAPSPSLSSTNVPGGEDSSTDAGNGRTNTTGVAPGAAANLAAATAAAPPAAMDAYGRLPGGATAQLPMLPPGAAAAAAAAGLPYHPHYGAIPLAAAASPLLDSRLLLAAQHPLVGAAAGAAGSVPLSLLAAHAHGKALPPSYLGHPAAAFYPYLP